MLCAAARWSDSAAALLGHSSSLGNTLNLFLHISHGVRRYGLFALAFQLAQYFCAGFLFSFVVER